MKNILACLMIAALVLSFQGCSVSAMEQGLAAAAGGTGAESPTVEFGPVDAEELLEYGVQYIRTDGNPEDAAFPAVRLIPNRAALEAYYEENRQNYYLERREQVYSDTSVGFLDACDRYDESFFEGHYLLLVLLEEGSGSVRHQVEKVSVEPEGQINISVTSLVPEVGTCDMAQWHLILELEKQEQLPEENALRLFLDGNLRWAAGSPVVPGKEPAYKTPPEGTLHTPAGSYPLVTGGYSWFYTQGEQLCAVCADQAGRPLGKEHLLPVEISSQSAETVYMQTQSGEVGYLMKLYWPVSPNEITVTCWKETVWSGKYVREETVAVMDVDGFYAKAGAYVYEIKAVWEDSGEGYWGSANYYTCIRTPDHGHQLAETPQTVEDPFVGYCGNTRTTLYVGEQSWSFMYGNSVALTDILLNLDYKRGMTCRCMAEYTVDTEFGVGYGINLTKGFARCEKGQAQLTPEQVEQIGEIIQWAVTTDCKYPME